MKTKARFLVVLLFLASITACVPIQFPEQPVQSPQEQPTEEILVKETEEIIVPTPAVEVEETEALESGGVEVVEPEEVDEAEPTTIEIPFEPTASTPDPDNLVKNGYFLDGYEYWERELVDEGGSSKMIIRESNNSDFDRELWMNQEGLGNLAMRQMVPIPTTRVTFSATFEMTNTSGPMWIFNGSGYAIIVLGYYDANQEFLGFTRILNVDESFFTGTAFYGAPEGVSDTNTQHNIQLNSDQVYKNYTIDVHEELNENLLAINPSDVAYIQISLGVATPDSGSSGTLVISDIVIK